MSGLHPFHWTLRIIKRLNRNNPSFDTEHILGCSGFGLA